MDMAEWLKQHAASFVNERLDDNFDFQEFEPKHAFFKAVHLAIKEKKNFTKWLDWILKEIEKNSMTDVLCKDLLEADDLKIIKEGDRLTHSTVEIFQTARIINQRISVIEVNVDQTPTRVSEYCSAGEKKATEKPKIFLYLLDETFLYDDAKQKEQENGKEFCDM